MNRQFGFYMAQKTAMKNNLIALLDQTYPGANDFFDSPARSDGSQKWVDFVHTYWHVDLSFIQYIIQPPENPYFIAQSGLYPWLFLPSSLHVSPFLC